MKSCNETMGAWPPVVVRSPDPVVVRSPDRTTHHGQKSPAVAVVRWPGQETGPHTTAKRALRSGPVARSGDRATTRSSDRATTRSSDRATTRSSDRATTRSSDHAEAALLHTLGVLQGMPLIVGRFVAWFLCIAKGMTVFASKEYTPRHQLWPGLLAGGSRRLADSPAGLKPVTSRPKCA